MPETEGKIHAFIHARLHAVRSVSRSPHMRDLARGGQHPPSEAAATGVAGPVAALSGSAARWGALSFMVSDAVLALDKFHVAWDGAKVVVMVTYYLGQLGIAWSVHGSACRGAGAKKEQ